MQDIDDVDPGEETKEPTGHALHWFAPSVFEKVPGGHNIHNVGGAYDGGSDFE